MFPLNQSIETSKETCVNYATGAPPNMGALFPAKSCRTESIAGVASGKGQHRTCHLRTFLGAEFKWEQPRKKLQKVWKASSEQNHGLKQMGQANE